MVGALPEGMELEDEDADAIAAAVAEYGDEQAGEDVEETSSTYC